MTHLLLALLCLLFGALVTLAGVCAPSAWLDDRTERMRDE